MFQIKTIIVPFAVLFLLGGCVSTATDFKRSGNSPKKTEITTTGNTKQSVEDVYLGAVSGKKFDETLLRVSGDSLDDNKKIIIKMQPDFWREFRLCENTSCQKIYPVVPASSQSFNYNPATGDDFDDSLIAEVELSDKTQSLIGRSLKSSSKSKRILIMTPDVELSTLTAGGLKEPNALWTATATNYVTEISTQYFQKMGYDVSLYKAKANSVAEKTGQDLINLHGAVGLSIMLYQQNSMFQLPTLSNGKFDWQLGATTNKLRDTYGADYGLFVYLRDSYSSGSRVAAQFLVAALFGASIPGGQQLGFASLVNLKTGEIEWFNRIFSTTGDLRTFDAALKATDALLIDIPL